MFHPPILRMEKDRVSEALYFPIFEYLMMNKVQESSNSECYTQVSEQTNKQTNKLHGPSPRANYTDRATAACR
jgi:hypothetical protein